MNRGKREKKKIHYRRCRFEGSVEDVLRRGCRIVVMPSGNLEDIIDRNGAAINTNRQRRRWKVMNE